MQFLISSTGVDFTIKDLGVLITHPTVDRDLAAEFTIEEIQESEDLEDALQNGDLTLKLETVEYGIVSVDGYEYRPTVLLEQSFRDEFQEGLVAEKELAAGFLDIEIVSGVFPIPVSSTTSGTQVVVVNTATLFDWKAAIGDKVSIVGGSAAGTYTISSVISQTQFSVTESIPTSISSGSLTIYHPPGSTKIGVNTSSFTEVSGSDLQDVLQDIDTALGAVSLDGYLDELGHLELDTLLHNLNEDFEVVPVFDGYGVISSVVAQGQGGGNLIRDFTGLTADSDGLITGYIVRQYDSSGVETERLTSTVNITSSLPQNVQVDKT